MLHNPLKVAGFSVCTMHNSPLHFSEAKMSNQSPGKGFCTNTHTSNLKLPYLLAQSLHFQFLRAQCKHTKRNNAIGNTMEKQSSALHSCSDTTRDLRFSGEL